MPKIARSIESARLSGPLGRFVEMEGSDDAAKAISEFDGKDLKGRNLKVNEAKPREFGGGGGGRDNRGGGGRAGNRW